MDRISSPRPSETAPAQAAGGARAWLNRLLRLGTRTAPGLEKTTQAYADRPEATQALLTSLDAVATRLEGAAPAAPAPAARFSAMGPVSEVITNRARELPYERPADLRTITADAPLDLSALDPDETYLWVATGDAVLLAPERQAGHGVNPDRPEGRKVNHGDMNPGPEGQSRGPARAGGELTAVRGEDGRVRWQIDLNSSYAFNREDGKLLGDANLAAVVDHLASTGTDVSDLAQVGSVYNPLKSVVGKIERTLQKVGLGVFR